MTEFLIRPARQADALAIARIHASTGVRTGMQVPPGDGTSARELRFWREAIGYAEPQLHVACAAEEVIGVVGFDRSRDPGTSPTMGEIWTIQVLPAFCGQGAGLALWDAAREELVQEGCTEVSIWIGLETTGPCDFTNSLDSNVSCLQREPPRKMVYAASRSASSAG